MYHTNTMPAAQKRHTKMTSYGLGFERGVSAGMEEGAERDLRPIFQTLLRPRFWDSCSALLQDGEKGVSAYMEEGA